MMLSDNIRNVHTNTSSAQKNHHLQPTKHRKTTFLDTLPWRGLIAILPSAWRDWTGRVNVTFDFPRVTPDYGSVGQGASWIQISYGGYMG